MAFIADCNRAANCWLRSGDAHTANNFKGIVQDTLSRLKNKETGLVRLDSGFYDRQIFEFLENEELKYIAAVPFYAPIQKLIAGQKRWNRDSGNLLSKPGLGQATQNGVGKTVN